MSNAKSEKLSGSLPVSRRAGTQSIERAARLLRAIAGNNRTGLRLVDLVAHTGLEQPTAYRILKSLKSENLVMQGEANRRYFLGPLMFEAGLAAAQQFSLRDICQESLARIAEKTGDTVFLTLRSGVESVCIDRKEGVFPIKVFTVNIGDRRPLGVGAGSLAILSGLSEEDAQRITGANAAVLPRYGKLNAQLLMKRAKSARERGYAIYKLWTLQGVKALGVAVRNAFGEPIAAISISGISGRLSAKRSEQLVSLLKKEALLVERRISHREVGQK